MNILELAEIISEAAGYLEQAQKRGVEIREPIVDELHGFAALLTDGAIQDKARITTLEAELLAARDLLAGEREACAVIEILRELVNELHHFVPHNHNGIDCAGCAMDARIAEVMLNV